jgi:hypothetical protein
MRAERWEDALEDFTKAHDLVDLPLRGPLLGMASVCLHRLGRYAEAEAQALQGLGEQKALIAVGTPFSEAELLARWAGPTTPVVSIICTTFNHERYIETAIRGFLSQDTSHPFEIIIHDDASTDGTQSVIRQWQAQYPSIIRTILQTENQLSRGGRPFDLLLSAARGAYIATCEGDDFWVDTTKLQRQVSFLEARSDYACSAHNHYLYTEAKLTVKTWLGSRRDLTLTQRELMGMRRLLWLPTLVFRRVITEMPVEARSSRIGDQFLTSILGTYGKCMYFEGLIGAVRRENPYSAWTPVSEIDKERERVRSWVLMVRMHSRLGNDDAIVDLHAKVAASPLPEPEKSRLVQEALRFVPTTASGGGLP